MTMDRSNLMKPFEDLIEKMEHDDPVRKKLLRAHERLNRARRRVGLPPLKHDAASRDRDVA
jgi:hypothetical protein